MKQVMDRGLNVDLRTGLALEAAREIDEVIFDKTGTLTEGRFGVTDTLVPVERTPGGDFGWLKKSYRFTIDGAAFKPFYETYDRYSAYVNVKLR